MSGPSATLAPAEVRDLQQRFQGAAPEEILEWALGRFHPRIAIASSFGAEDVVLMHMARGISPEARIFTLDTLRLHTETYALMDRVAERYGGRVEVIYPDLTAVARMVEQHGFNCFYRGIEHRKLCCGVRKVEPLQRALSGLDAWITGVRRDQAPTRTETRALELDDVHGGIVKVNPLVEWSSKQVWSYIQAHGVPYNALHDAGFSSIGCAPCTRAVAPGEDERAGRWWWEDDPTAKECGIHVGYEAGGAPRAVRGTSPSPA